MTRMMRHVRVSVRLLSQTADSEWGTPDETYTHDRYQTLQSLSPLSGEAIQRLQREGFYADWTATVRRRPAIPDGSRIVTFDEHDEVDMVFHVDKVLPRGRRATLLLRETREEQE